MTMKEEHVISFPDGTVEVNGQRVSFADISLRFPGATFRYERLSRPKRRRAKRAADKKAKRASRG